jgi:hypothetical protein
MQTQGQTDMTMLIVAFLQFYEGAYNDFRSSYEYDYLWFEALQFDK